MAEQKKNQGAPVVEEQLTKGETLLVKYKKQAIIAVVAVMVVVAGAIAYNTYVAGPREAKASTALAKAQQLFAAQQYEMALKGDSTGTLGFLAIADQYSSTDAGNLAHLYAGLCYANTDKWQEAANELEDYDGADDQMISPAALGALGNAYAHLNNLDKAVSTLKKAAKKADNNSLSPLFLIQAGQILESQGKKSEALELYKEIKTKYFASMQYQTIDSYIERVSE